MLKRILSRVLSRELYERLCGKSLSRERAVLILQAGLGWIFGRWVHCHKCGGRLAKVMVFGRSHGVAVWGMHVAVAKVDFADRLSLRFAHALAQDCRQDTLLLPVRPQEEAAGSPAVLHTLLTHWPASEVDALVRHHLALDPRVGFLVAYGGKEEEFERIAHPDKVFLSDPCLRGPTDHQNYGCWVRAVRDFLQGRPVPEAIYFTETDHMMFQRNYSTDLLALLSASGKDFLGKWCMARNDSNEFFYLRYRDDAVLRTQLARYQKSPAELVIWGALADGMLFKREAFLALAAADLEIACFTEILFPSLLAAMGFALGDFDSYSDYYRHVRYRPDYRVEDVLRLRKDGAWCCHPYKDRGQMYRFLEIIP